MTDKVSRTSTLQLITQKKLTLSIVPSVSPGLAAENVKKIQCFCFSEQTLEPYETQEWAVRFYVDSELSENVNNVYLSYTLFEKEREEMLAVNHEH